MTSRRWPAVFFILFVMNPLGAAHASINLLQDGDFEFFDLSGVAQGNFTTVGAGPFGAWQVVIPENSNTFTTIDVWNDPTWVQEDPSLADVGGAVIDMNGSSPGGLHQSVNVTAGQTYELALHQFNNGLDLRVVVEDNLAGIVFDEIWTGGLDAGSGVVVGVVPSNNATWERLSGSFVASGTQLLVRLESIEIDPNNIGGLGPFIGSFIDDVSLQAVAAVPEATSILVWMVLLCWGSIAANRLSTCTQFLNR